MGNTITAEYFTKKCKVSNKIEKKLKRRGNVIKEKEQLKIVHFQLCIFNDFSQFEFCCLSSTKKCVTQISIFAAVKLWKWSIKIKPVKATIVQALVLPFHAIFGLNSEISLDFRPSMTPKSLGTLTKHFQIEDT